jgi:hypothetical protein
MYCIQKVRSVVENLIFFGFYVFCTVHCALKSRTHTLIHQTAHTDTYKTYHTAYTTVFLRMNPRGSKHVGDKKIDY